MPITFKTTVQVVPTDPWITLDGRLLAPSGPSQFPHLLDVSSSGTQTYGETLAVRPPWRVAGVDYAVGIPSGTVLKDPGTQGSPNASLPAGCAFSSANVITCSGNNRTVDGWDFSLHGGYQLQVTGNNALVQNCNFATDAGTTFTTGNDSCLWFNGGGGNTAKYNVVDGTNAILTSTNGLLNCGPTNTAGTLTLMYNWVRNAPPENITIGNDTTNLTVIAKYNVIENGGMGFSSGLHGDWIQIINGNSTHIVTAYYCEYNTFIQNANANLPGSGPRAQGVTFPSVGAVLYESFSHNTVMAPGTAFVNAAVIIAPKELNGYADVMFNYIDSYVSGGGIGSASTGSLINTTPGGDGSSFNGTINIANNLNIRSGAAIST